jgi:hypothetical protein
MFARHHFDYYLCAGATTSLYGRYATSVSNYPKEFCRGRSSRSSEKHHANVAENGEDVNKGAGL